jgi:hypothetical protein
MSTSPITDAVGQIPAILARQQPAAVTTQTPRQHSAWPAIIPPAQIQPTTPGSQDSNTVSGTGKLNWYV